ncbi:RDD family protein [Novosphingobium sp. FSY-8]|uniref:RDD family protein n=1 Tax=Novosphingobium ovatum TaxID=1908523 RepID=A0ABW9XGG9_9SPHN|nr:RDD family protein [Novosphingobium ovatum]NBC37564.1 RDD family protein [Novosphingobium ovatum]
MSGPRSTAAARRQYQTRRARRERQVVTPEGLTLTFTLATRGARVAALLLDVFLVFLVLIGFAIAVGTIANFLDVSKSPVLRELQEVFLILLFAGLFLLRYGWLLWFELGPRGASPGKRMLGIRVAARGGGRLTPDMVIARNLLRDLEVVFPLAFVPALFQPDDQSPLALALGAWFAIFALFALTNRDNLRPGDLIAGTWVVETPRRRLVQTMSAATHAQSHPNQTAYAFSDEDLAVYGEFELQTLERVLRSAQQGQMEAVAQSICAKIGWNAPSGYEVQPFLDAYYTQLRARLERGLRLGQRKSDKFDAGRNA